MKPILYLTSELVNRDWDSRLVIADHAVSLGLSVVVGQQWNVVRNIHVVPKGIILVKTMNTIQGNAMNACRQNGHIVVAMDEEALPVAIDRDVGQEFIARSYSQVAIDACHFFLANSPLHGEAVTRYMPALAKKTFVTGSARMDLLTEGQRDRYADQVQVLREKHGPLILFNSNTAGRNSIWSRQQFLDIQIRTGVLDPKDPVKVKFFEDNMAFEDKNAEVFEGLMKWCAANLPKHSIVVRPHPSENVDYWTKFNAENPRVHVAWATPHIPYMMVADVVVHTNCTTGIEAATLERPTVNLSPMPDSHWAQLYFAAQVCPTFTDLDSAIAALRSHIEGGAQTLSPAPEHRRELLRYYPCIEQAMSARTIAELMARILKNHGATLGQPIQVEEMRNQYKAFALEATLKKKFSKSPEDAVADIKATRRATKLTHALNISAIDDSLFLLSPRP